jgi:tetratricopeptide (TPR) repeat protein
VETTILRSRIKPVPHALFKGAAAIVSTGALLAVQLPCTWAITPAVRLPAHQQASDLLASSEYLPLSRGSALMSQGKSAEALNDLIMTVEQNPVNILGLYHLGSAYYELSRQAELPEQQAVFLEQAQQAYERVANLNDDLTMVYFRLGKIALIKNDTEAAKQYYLRGIQAEPQNAALIFNLARVYDQVGERDQAIRYYLQTVEKDPAFVFAYNNLGLLYEDDKAFEKAEKAYKQALKKDAHYNLARLNLGNMYAVTQNYRKAEKTLNDAQALEPDNEWVYYYLGNLRLRQGAYDQAVTAYNRALEINPDHATTYYLLAVSLTRLKRMDEALQASLGYMRLEPNGEYAKEMKSLIMTVKLSQHQGFGYQLLPSGSRNVQP